MAHHKSAKKAIRKTEKKTLINKSRKNRIRTFIKNLENIIASGDKAKASELFKATESEVMKGVGTKVLKLNTAARKVSRLSARIKAMA